MPPAAQILLLAEVLVAALVWTTWPVHYHLSTEGMWRCTQHGRNLQGLAATIAALLDFSLLSRIVVPSAPQRAVPVWLVVVAVVLYAALIYFGIRRHVLLWRDQHPTK